MKQAALDLPEDPSNEASLRATYERTGLRGQGISFEEAMKNPAMRICLSNINEARLRAQNDRQPLVQRVNV